MIDWQIELIRFWLCFFIGLWKAVDIIYPGHLRKPALDKG